MTVAAIAELAVNKFLFKGMVIQDLFCLIILSIIKKRFLEIIKSFLGMCNSQFTHPSDLLISVNTHQVRHHYQTIHN